MKDKYDFRILVIDDNLEIHHDFIKILTNPHKLSELDSIKTQIFGNQDADNASLPEFLIDTASRVRKV